MPWVVLMTSAVLEAVWATALGRSEGFTRLVPTLVFAVAIVLSVLGLGRAAKHIPISTAYAVWTGTGAALTVAWAVVTGDEAATALRMLFLAGIVASVVGLNVVKAPPVRGDSDSAGR
ncbi:DMT family transporter [Umezawaea beigongshangensis]|uniref:DMT family transporter n=1 Tax=Umezawaea beigongshangensis TaxID=2780383 RepID=UPI0018F14DFF|nr:multidrug efflux SMR transporter [Umezawaea beigongshangensis]